MISDVEMEYLVNSAEYLIKHTKGFRGRQKVEQMKLLIKGQVQHIRSGLNEGVCPTCLGTGKAVANEL